MNIWKSSVSVLRSHRGRVCDSANLRTMAKYCVSPQPFTVFIEGNIGSGKTTYLNHFQKFEDDICLITEPVNKWRNVKGVNLLELMYKEPKRWAMPFQSYVTLTMLQSHTQETHKRIKLMERSIYSARNCFVENMYKNGTIEEGMYYILQEWYHFIEKSIPIQADLIVYLRTSPEVVYERMRRRDRSEESCVPLKYLQELHELHEDWLIRKRSVHDTKVLVLDANLDLEHIGSEYKLSEDSIMNASMQQQLNTALQQPQAVLVSPVKRKL